VRPYEITIIFDAGLEEDAIRAVIDRASEAIRSRGGNPGRVDRWGRRRFAYELAHRWEGYYVLLEASAEPSAVAEADRVLSLADDVLRYKIVRIPESAGRRARPETGGRRTVEAG
jgi:small subunit ribosomal protein S6